MLHQEKPRQQIMHSNNHFNSSLIRPLQQQKGSNDRVAPIAQAECSDTDFESSRRSSPDKNTSKHQIQQQARIKSQQLLNGHKINGHHKQNYELKMLQNSHKGIIRLT